MYFRQTSGWDFDDHLEKKGSEQKKYPLTGLQVW